VQVAGLDPDAVLDERQLCGIGTAIARTVKLDIIDARSANLIFIFHFRFNFNNSALNFRIYRRHNCRHVRAVLNQYGSAFLGPAEFYKDVEFTRRKGIGHGLYLQLAQNVKP
jgi:hypothetical protein